MRVLVTGASGFVGSSLADRLIREGHDVRLLMRSTSSRANLNENRFTAIAGDLRQADTLAAAVADVDLIFHVAGIVAAPRPQDYFSANEDGTRNLAAAAVRFGNRLKRFVLVSSLAAAGPSAPGKPRVESDASKPISVYGRSKLAGEKTLEAFPELPSVIVRPPVVYGPRDKGMLTFFQIMNYGILPVLPTPAGGSAYSLIHVDDLVSALSVLGFSDKAISPGETFYASGPGVFTWEETMLVLAQAFGKRPRRLSIPFWPLRLTAKGLGWLGRRTGKSFPLNDDKIEEITQPFWHCEARKLTMQMGFTPYWTLDAGFRQTLFWYRDRRWL